MGRRILKTIGRIVLPPFLDCLKAGPSRITVRASEQRARKEEEIAYSSLLVVTDVKQGRLIGDSGR